MKRLKEAFSGYKTYIVAILFFLLPALKAKWPELQWEQLFAILFGAGFAALRAGISKVNR